MDELWKGLPKLTEEAGELHQVVGKIAEFLKGNHPDGNGPLDERLVEELADTAAFIEYICGEQTPQFNQNFISRFRKNLRKYQQWGLSGYKVQGNELFSVVCVAGWLSGRTALAQAGDHPNVLMVQLDDLDHAWGTGWHPVPECEWRRA